MLRLNIIHLYHTVFDIVVAFMKNKEIYKRCVRELNSSTSLEMLKVAAEYCNLFILNLKTEDYWKNVYRSELQDIYTTCAKKLTRK